MQPPSPTCSHTPNPLSIFSTQVSTVNISMPQGKRVHFVDPITDDVFYPDMLNPPVIPPTPSPTYSTTSLPSPPFPSTPSSSRSHYAPLPLVGPYGIIQQVHPAVSYDNRIAPRLQFDVTVSPSHLIPLVPNKGGWLSTSLRPSVQQSPLTGRSPSLVPFELSLLDEPVTYPQMTSIILFSDLLPWSTRIEAETPGSAVTIFDVLDTLHTALRTPISKSEWNSLPPHTQNAVSTSFYHRLGGIQDHSLRDKQFRRGVRRLDFLLGNTKLLGIAPVPNKPDGFTLYWGSAA